MSDIKAKIQTLRNSKSEDDRRACIGLLADYLGKHPDDTESWYDKACCHDFIGEEQGAEPCYWKCYELGWQMLPGAEHKSFFVGYGSTLRNNLKYSESISVLKEGIKHFPDYAPLKVFLGLSYYSNGQDRLAAETLFPACLESARKGLDGFERAIQHYCNHLQTPARVTGAEGGNKTLTNLSHIELNVSDYAKSIRFYDMVLIPLGWRRLSCLQECTSFTDGQTKLILSPTEPKYLQPPYHRKRVGLNHIALYVDSKEKLDQFYEENLKKNGISCLYEGKPSGESDYYAVLFEDPDRIKLEVVFAPGYCEPHHWTNQFEDTFDPSEKK